MCIRDRSGNVSLKNVAMIAKTGVDRISVGRITHSASALDFKLEIWRIYFQLFSEILLIIYFFNSACAADNIATGTL